jgi:hypothetical protein
MIYKKGKYLNVCGFYLCGIDFYGRANKLYCSQECKQAHNNRKTSKVSKAAKGEDLKIRKAIRILLDLFKADKEGKFIISTVDLVSKAFPFDLPTIIVKDDRYNGTMSAFGSFCFYKKEGHYIFYKI